MKRIDADEPELARVGNHQPLLLPATPREICRSVGLDWWAAIKLWDDGHLSFDPQTTASLSEAQHSELVFLGALVSGGCEPEFLKNLLIGLSKPYAYQIHLIYYDWLKRRWRPIPQPPSCDEREKLFSEWVQELEDAHDVEMLQQMAAHIEYCLNRLQNKIADENRETAREVLKTTPGLAEGLIDLWMSGEPDYENGLMGLPTDEELEDMVMHRSKRLDNSDLRP